MLKKDVELQDQHQGGLRETGLYTLLEAGWNHSVFWKATWKYAPEAITMFEPFTSIIPHLWEQSN